MKLFDRVDGINYSLLDSDDSVFHYTKVKTALEKIFDTKSIRFSIFSNTNDPLEYNKRFLGIQTNIDVSHEVTRCGWDAKKLLETIMLKNAYFFSTCTNSYCKGEISSCGYLKTRMWSQYGENQEGLCFVLSKKEIIKKVIEKYGAEAYAFHHKKIKYYSDISSLYGTSIVDTNAIIGNGIDKFAISYINKYSSKLFFMKQDDYRDEKEYRFLLIDKQVRNGIDISIPIESIIKTVIVGDKFHKAYYPCLEKINRNLDVQFLKLKWFSNRFLLDKIF